MLKRSARLGLILAALVLAALQLTGCATVPHTGRTALNFMSDDTMNKMALDSYRQVLSKSRLSQNRAQVAALNRVGHRISRAAVAFMQENGQGNALAGYQWEYSLIDDDKTVNAWAMPGGKIAFYSGIMPLAQNETGLAVVMGHEVAHVLAKHGNERMSQQLLVALGGVALAVALHDKPAETQAIFLAVYGAGAAVGFTLPYSRVHEYEADRIGLVLMARAGYDPRAAPAFWERMAARGGGGRTPEFLSTHPAPASRIQHLRQLVPEAMQYYRPNR